MWSIDQARRADVPVFVQLAEAIVADVRRGALRGGDKLPSTRTLAEQMQVNRNTIVAAYDELVAQGWAVADGPAGTRIAGDIPERNARRPAVATHMAARAGFSIPEVEPIFVPGPVRARAPEVHRQVAEDAKGSPGTRGRSAMARASSVFAEPLYSLSAGVPDPRLAPTTDLARAYRRALRGAAGREALSYGDPLGVPRLREAIAELVRTTRGIPATADNVMIVRGSQMGIELAARLLFARELEPGSTSRSGARASRALARRASPLAAVEAIGYPPAWRSLAGAGALLVGVPLDEAGIIVDEIPAGARCVYTTPHHQYPTTVTMSPARRMALLARARRDGMAIIEDDYDYEFHFEGRPVAPLAATDRGETVIYAGTLSKTLAPGLRLGFVVAHERVIEQLGRLRFAIDRQGDQVLELAVASLLEDGELQRHARKQRRVIAARREALIAALDKELRGRVEITVPPGGITLWVRVADDIDLAAWQATCAALGVGFAMGKDYALDGKRLPFIRLAFARYSESELTDAVRRMKRALS
jgi:GntR family transcriptional regulator/MocR family aminotransferase